jgi:hypothetical protein
MALNISDYGPKIVEVVGQFAPIAFGVATASSTSLDVTIPQFSQIYAVIVQSSSTTTAGYTATISGNNFDCTVGSAEVCFYVAFGRLKG